MEELIKFLNPFYYLGLFFKPSETPLTSKKLSEEPLKVVEEKPVKLTEGKIRRKIKKNK